MRVSVIVPAFNEERVLASSLASVRAAMQVFTARGWASELIVCDNNSSDRTADIARAAGARVVVEPINQISRARNAGAAEATGQWLVFVDADSHPTPGLFADAADAMAQGRALAGGSTLAHEGSRLPVQIVARGWNVISRINRWAAGSFIFCEADAFRQVGGFSLELFATEEIDLFRRLKTLARRRGRSIVILTRHPLHTSDRKLDLYSGREMLRFYVRALLRGRRAFRNRGESFIWYDGRR